MFFLNIFFFFIKIYIKSRSDCQQPVASFAWCPSYQDTHLVTLPGFSTPDSAFPHLAASPGLHNKSINSTTSAALEPVFFFFFAIFNNHGPQGRTSFIPMTLADYFNSPKPLFLSRLGPLDSRIQGSRVAGHTPKVYRLPLSLKMIDGFCGTQYLVLGLSGCT